MKKLGRLLNEVKGEKAHREAVAMGLKYKGFGYWVDPSTGETKYKTENDQLVAVDPDVESEKAGPDKDADMASGPGGNPMGAMSTGMQMQQPAGTLPQPGTLPLGAPNPGEEIAPKEMEWEPGPDGSTCVDSDNPPAEVPEDSYVSRKNNLNWGAGPDGTNYTNIDYAKMIYDLRNPTMDSFLNRQAKMEEIEQGQQRTFLSTFMAEAPQAGAAADEARAKGLNYSGYGYWKDSSGRVVAQTQGDQLVMLDDQGGNTAATTDMGNPTGPQSGMTPAAKARSMGLTSNGSGGYVDKEGNVIARTVNNELVFYDSRAGGGAVSDGSGGAMLTQSSPSWVDPVTGLIVVPPGQPESPVEINAVPDPIPATPPAGYDSFVQQRKLQMYQQDAERREAEAIEAQIQADNEEATGVRDVLNPPMQFENFIDEALGRRLPKKLDEPTMGSVPAEYQAATQGAERANPDLKAEPSPGPKIRNDGAHQPHLGQRMGSFGIFRKERGDALRQSLNNYKDEEEVLQKEHDRLTKVFDNMADDKRFPMRLRRSAARAQGKALATDKARRRDAGFNVLSGAQIGGLLENADEVREAFANDPETGMPDPKKIQAYKEKRMAYDYPKEMLDALWRSHPAPFRSNYGGGDISAREGHDDWYNMDGIDLFTNQFLAPGDLNQDHLYAKSLASKGDDAMREFGASRFNSGGTHKAVNQLLGGKEKPEFFDQLEERYGKSDYWNPSIQDELEAMNETKFELQGMPSQVIQETLMETTPDGRRVFKEGVTQDTVQAVMDMITDRYNTAVDPIVEKIKELDTEGLLQQRPSKLDDAAKARRKQIQQALQVAEKLRGQGDIKDLYASIGMPKGRDSGLPRSYYGDSIRGGGFAGVDGEALRLEVLKQNLMGGLGLSPEEQAERQDLWQQVTSDANGANRRVWDEHHEEGRGPLINGMEGDEAREFERGIRDDNERRYLQALIDAGILKRENLPAEHIPAFDRIMGREALYESRKKPQFGITDEEEYPIDEDGISLYDLLGMVYQISLHGMSRARKPNGKTKTFEQFRL